MPDSLLRSPFLEGSVELPALELAQPGTPLFEAEDAYARPKDWPKLESDTKLRLDLKKLKTRAARGLEDALEAVSKPETFERKLSAALGLTPWASEKGSTQLQVVLARLGAEAFILGTQVPEANRIQVGFVNHPERLLDTGSLAQRVYFLHFTCERLRGAASKISVPAEHERHLGHAATLFRWFQGELRRDYSFTGIEKSQLLAYRRLLVAIIWKHYQALFDHWLEQARRAPTIAKDALKALQAHLSTTVVTQVIDDDARLPTFSFDSKVFHDYFTPKSASDFAYSYFSVHAKASTQKPFESSFAGVVRRRADQWSYFRDLLAESGAEPLPSFARSESWQRWLMTAWDGAWQGLAVPERLRKVLLYVQRYFQLFTLHVPHNLREGCKEPSYLTRSFPRALNGASIHDCAVYAARWLHILGALIDAKKPASAISKPRAWLVEMPVHVGVMIRLNPDSKRELLISINNSDGALYEIDPTLKDTEAARQIIEDVYHDLATPFVLHALKSSATDSKALWSELCRLLEKRMVLPYKDSREPHLLYLEYKAELAKVTNHLSATLNTYFAALGSKLAKTTSRAQKVKDLEHYQSQVAAALLVAVREYDALKPFVERVSSDLRDHTSRIPKAATLASTSRGLPPPWWRSATTYQAVLTQAVKSGDAANLHPSAFFPEDDFIASVE